MGRIPVLPPLHGCLKAHIRQGMGKSFADDSTAHVCFMLGVGKTTSTVSKASCCLRLSPPGCHRCTHMKPQSVSPARGRSTLSGKIRTCEGPSLSAVLGLSGHLRELRVAPGSFFRGVFSISSIIHWLQLKLLYPSKKTPWKSIVTFRKADLRCRTGS